MLSSQLSLNVWECQLFLFFYFPLPSGILQVDRKFQWAATCLWSAINSVANTFQHRCHMLRICHQLSCKHLPAFNRWKFLGSHICWILTIFKLQVFKHSDFVKCLDRQEIIRTFIDIYYVIVIDLNFFQDYLKTLTW